MSEVLQDFAKPLFLERGTDSEVKDAIKFSILIDSKEIHEAGTIKAQGGESFV